MPSRTTRFRYKFRKRGQNYYPASKSHQLIDVTGDGGIVIGGSADIEVGGSTVSVDSSVRVLVDWDGDGDFSESVEDITPYVLSCQTRTGRDWPSLLTGNAGPGQFKSTLNNTNGWFNHFKADSPLNIAPFSTDTGGIVRVQLDGTTPDDPIIIARDRFRRNDGALGNDEYGHAWINPIGNWKIVSGLAVAQTEGQPHLAYVDVGAADYYVQALLNPGSLANTLGIVYRYVNSINYSYVAIRSDIANLVAVDVVSGVPTIISSSLVEVYNGVTLGVLVAGSAATIYLEGVAGATFTAINTSATKIGIYGNWGTGDTAPAADNFYAWNDLGSEVNGILWTGDFSTVYPTVSPSDVPTANLEAEGWLSKLATLDITPPTSAVGRRTGYLMGAVLANSVLLHPPAGIDQGVVTTGPFAIATTKAINVTRAIEETELGFVHERNTGGIKFESRTARDALFPVVEFSDHAGAQFTYESVGQQDWKREVFNRVQAGLSPYSIQPPAVLYTDPGPYILAPGQTVTLNASYSGSSGVVTQWTGHTRQVAAPQPPAGITVPVAFADAFRTGDDSNVPYDYTVTLPTTTNGDLLLFVGCTGTLGAPWNGSVPSGWELIHQGSYTRPFVLARIAVGNESGNTFHIQSDYDSNSVHIAYFIMRVTNWFGNLNGSIQVIGTTNGAGSQPDPPAITPVWGAIPTLFVACSYASLGGSTMPDMTAVPTGYTAGSESNDGASYEGFVNLTSAYKVTTTTTEDPGTFTGNSAITNASTTQWFTFTIAVRGSAAPIPITGSTPAGSNPTFTVPYDNGVGGTTQSVTDIAVTGILLAAGDNVSVQADDYTSQDVHRVIKTYQNPANLYASTTDALVYANLVLSKYANDRPIIVMKFTANKSAAYREQAKKRRVGDMIYLTADNPDGANLGISGQFIIEAIVHDFSHGIKLWTVTWELSPAFTTT